MKKKERLTQEDVFSEIAAIYKDAFLSEEDMTIYKFSKLHGLSISAANKALKQAVNDGKLEIVFKKDTSARGHITRVFVPKKNGTRRT